MSTSYVVQRGDCLSSIASRFGFANWRTIYDAPDNAEFRRKRTNPNLIYPGDIIEIPAKPDRQIAVASGAAHRFRLNRQLTWVRLEIKVKEPHRYLLEIGTESFRGVTTGSSAIAHPVDPEAKQGKIRLWPDGHDAPAGPPDDAMEWKLEVGGLDPIEEVSGVQGRLLNLGYYNGPITDDVDELTAAAIRWFQKDQGLRPTGVIDATLRDKLVEVHDGG